MELGGPIPDLLVQTTTPNHVSGIGGPLRNGRLPYRDASGEATLALPAGIHNVTSLNEHVARLLPAWHDPFVFACTNGLVTQQYGGRGGRGARGRGEH